MNHLLSASSEENDWGVFQIDEADWEGKRQFLYVVDLDKVIRCSDKQIISNQAFCNIFSRYHSKKDPHTNIRHFLKNGKLAYCASINYQPQHYSRYQSVVSSHYGELIYNTYQPTDCRANKDPHPHIDSFLSYLLPDETERNILLNWMAIKVQNPAQRINWMPTLVGPPGIGKGVLFEQILSRLVGQSNVMQASESLAMGRFTDWMENELIFIPEIDDDTPTLMTRLKPLITDSAIPIESKGLKPRTANNVASLIGSSNNDMAFKIDQGDRRHTMLTCTLDKQSVDYFHQLIKVIPSEINGLYGSLMARDVPVTFASTAPQTKKNESVINRADLPYYEDVERVLECGGDVKPRLGEKLSYLPTSLSTKGRPFVLQEELVQAVVSLVVNSDKQSRLTVAYMRKNIDGILTKMGYVVVKGSSDRGRVKINKIRCTIWVDGMLPEGCHILDSGEAEKMIISIMS